MIYTGFRIGEVFTILKENVHLDEGYIIGGIKTEAGKDRIVPLPPQISEIKALLRAGTTRAAHSFCSAVTSIIFAKEIFILLSPSAA